MLNTKNFLIGFTLILLSSQSFSATTPLKVPELTIKSYAKDFSVSEIEASRRLNIMANSNLISQKLIDKFGENLIAGVFFEHDGDFKINVRTTKQGQKSRDVLNFVNKELPDLNIEVIPNSPRNFHAIENIIKNQSDVLSKKISGFQSLAYNPAKDKLIISVYEPSLNSVSDFYNKYGFEKISGMETEVEILKAPIDLAVLMGGVKLSKVVGGGAICTSGFSAYSSDGTLTPGMITAYHCTVNETIKNVYLTDINGNSHPLTLSPPKASANHDMALYLAPKGTPISASVSNGTGYPANIAALGHRVNLIPSLSYVCHNGMNTGFSCGLVVDIKATLPAMAKDVAGNSIARCKTSQTNCNPVFIKISSPKPNFRCGPGDSGGPVLEGYSGYGIVSSCNVNEQAIYNAQPAMWASTLDYAYELPASFAVSP